MTHSSHSSTPPAPAHVEAPQAEAVHVEAAQAEAVRGTAPGAARRPSETAPDLPGCESFPMTERECVRSDERIEFWCARTETAWRVREVHVQHEQPAQRLPWLVSRISAVRGSPVECFGSVSLVRRDRAGRRRWVMQADQIVYLHPQRSRPATVVRVGEDPLPDVVLEVDHTTDVRRWKLAVYQECGFPEIWVSVPWESSARAPGLTIHLRDGARYRASGESRAFPGWRVEAIHRALTEQPLSGVAWQALERVGRALGAREGTRPDHDPLSRSLRAEARTEGRAEGEATGYGRGRAEGIETGQLAAVLALLRTRGIATDPALAADRGRLTGASLETLMAAAMACTDEADFRRRIAAPPPT